jgi:aryl-alcohol dehydrogenase-like predicted oxidoreductase
VFRAALSGGVTLFNSATFYGPLNQDGFGTNLRLIAKCIQGLERSSYQLAVKICMDTRCPPEKTGQVWVNRGNAAGIREDVDFALSTLGVDFIDVIILCRVSPEIPIEESIAGMKMMVDEGKAKYIGVSEASAATIRRAHAIHPLFCIEQEWSLWTRDIEADIVPTCRELGIKILAYSPLGRGFLTDELKSLDGLDANDFRRSSHPRTEEANIAKNLALVDNLKALANEKGITTGQLALAWVHAQGDDVIPIPGTTSLKHLKENLAAAEVILTAEDLRKIEELCPASEVGGTRYVNMGMTFHGQL